MVNIGHILFNFMSIFIEKDSIAICQLFSDRWRGKEEVAAKGISFPLWAMKTSTIR